MCALGTNWGRMQLHAGTFFRAKENLLANTRLIECVSKFRIFSNSHESPIIRVDTVLGLFQGKLSIT